MEITIGQSTTAYDPPVTINLDGKQFRHGWLLGKTGTGKSVFLRNIVAEAIHAGLGVWVVEPADLVYDCLNYVTASRVRDLLYLGPDSDPVPGIGFFDEPDKELAVQTALSIAESHAGSGWGPETAHIFRNAMDAVLEVVPHPTILHVARFLADSAFARRTAAQSKNQLVKFFYKQYFEELKALDRARAFSHPLNKAEEFLRPGLVEFFCQREPLNFVRLLDEQKIMFCRLPKGTMGKRPSSVLGSLILSKIDLAAPRRKKRKRPVLVVVDEVHNFIKGVDFETMLAESRKYGIHYLFATQTVRQMRENAEIAFGNVSHIFSSRISADDAEAVARNIGAPLADEFLVKMPNYHVAALTMIDDKPVPQSQVKLRQYPPRYGYRAARKSLEWAKNNTPGTWRKDIPQLVRTQLAA